MNAPLRVGGAAPTLAVVVKGYPRLSETFISQEILALERTGFPLEIWSLRLPTDKAVHPLNKAIRAKAHYLPEYLYEAPMRVLRGALAAVGMPGFGRLMRAFWKDLLRDPTPNRGRRLGQAFVFARELDPRIRHVHVHYLHTPCSVVRYMALLTGRTFSVSAHAKDIWTTPAWEKREKLADAAFAVTCTQAGIDTLRPLCPPDDPQRVGLVYHGLDLSRFPAPPATRPARDGSDPADPVVILSVGRAVAKKGYDDLLEALAGLPAALHWRFVHIGSGELRDSLKAAAARLGLSERITWMGGQAQDAVVEAMRSADLFVLACKEGDKGDRDGLPNVLMEAATQALPLLSTRFAGVPEFVRDGEEGLLVAPGAPDELRAALERLLREPGLRSRLGTTACRRVHEAFSFEAGIAALTERLAGLVPVAAPATDRP
ncbi:glycosyltransferase family 4 protein [uncultured Alsobacter sp.]|uniref:glycosyltransferase family 4 protein n=1 Tax=uncultured Alsobacter sp. TaxID=1748258 RepID=UPI0025FB56C5|nr:glycosyltransferase family 4 protein [uncultured Alsobacter sp.]